jgi:hypothetical protein
MAHMTTTVEGLTHEEINVLYGFDEDGGLVDE